MSDKLQSFSDALIAEHAELTARFEEDQADCQEAQANLKTSKSKLQAFRAQYGKVITALEEGRAATVEVVADDSGDDDADA